jgi:hypothetical protein
MLCPALKLGTKYFDQNKVETHLLAACATLFVVLPWEVQAEVLLLKNSHHGDSPSLHR